MNRIEIKEAAKKLISGNIGLLFLCNIVIYVMTYLVGRIPGVGYICSILISSICGVSLCFIYLNLNKGKKPEIENVFAGFKSEYLERGLITSLMMIGLVFLYTLLLVVPGIIKSLAYSMSTYLVVDDPKMSGMDALKASEKMMEGHKWELFVLNLSFIGWYLLVPFTFGLLLIYVEPYVQAANLKFYLELKEKNKKPTKSKKVKEVTAEVV